MNREQVCAHLGLDAQAPLHSGTYLRMAWAPFWRLASGRAPQP